MSNGYAELGLDGLGDLESDRDRGLVPYVRGLALVSWSTRGHWARATERWYAWHKAPQQSSIFADIIKSFFY